jgi:hypothetical protein
MIASAEAIDSRSDTTEAANRRERSPPVGNYYERSWRVFRVGRLGARAILTDGPRRVAHSQFKRIFKSSAH